MDRPCEVCGKPYVRAVMRGKRNHLYCEEHAPPQCSKRVYRDAGRMGSFGRCKSPAKYQVNGLWYCGVHNPETVAKRNAKRAKKDAALRESWRRENQRHKLFHLMEKLLERGVIIDARDGSIQVQVYNPYRCVGIANAGPDRLHALIVALQDALEESKDAEDWEDEEDEE